MAGTVSCDAVVAQGLLERYVAGTLADEEAQAFEAHFLTCDRCQHDLRLAAAIRASGVEGPTVAAPLVAGGRRAVLRVVAGAGALAAAAGLAVLLLTRSGAPDPALAALGRVLQPPIYLGLPVRGAEDRADTLFAEAMDAYVAENYREASAGLRSALEAGVEPAAAEFFLGASLLMLNRPDEAAEAYGRVIALGRTPYLQEAHWYRAKALLRLGRAEEAIAELRAARGENELGREADSLAVRVEELVRR